MSTTVRSPVVPVLALTLCVVGLFIYTLQTGVKASEHVERMRAALDADCRQRVVYDAKSQDVRRVTREYWVSYIQAEKLNIFIDDKLRKQRIENAQMVVHSLDEALDATVETDCDRYAAL